MDFPLLLLVLLALPFAAAGAIVAVSSVRRRGHAAATHRLQSDTAAVQDSAARPAPGAPRTSSGREGRAASAQRITGG